MNRVVMPAMDDRSWSLSALTMSPMDFWVTSSVKMSGASSTFCSAVRMASTTNSVSTWPWNVAPSSSSAVAAWPSAAGSR